MVLLFFSFVPFHESERLLFAVRFFDIIYQNDLQTEILIHIVRVKNRTNSSGSRVFENYDFEYKVYVLL